MTPLHVVPAKVNPHLERLGGRDAVIRLVDAFYGAMDSRPHARALRAMHAADLGPTKEVLTLYLVEWLGGPQGYTARRGPPRLGRVHRPFPIDAAARDAWMACMDEALHAVCTDEALRDDLRTAFGKLATHLQNTHEPQPAKPESHSEIAPHGLTTRTLHHPWRSR